MPEPDPTKTFIWLISCILFISVAAGGGFLVMYMTLPESQYTSWLPIVGVALVCLPWLFWFITCMYRIMSRACGFRMVCFNGGGGDISIAGGGGGGVVGGGGGNGGAHVVDTTFDEPIMNVEPPVGSPGSGARRVQFGGAVVLGEQGGGSQVHKNRKNSRSSSSNSIASHESELPLALSMAP